MYEVRIEVNIDVAKNDIDPKVVEAWVKRTLEEASVPGKAHYFKVQGVRLESELWGGR